MLEKEELNGMWGNVIAIVLLPFSIALQDDPLTYIRRAKSTMDRKKLSLAHQCACITMKLTSSFFGIKVNIYIYSLRVLKKISKNFPSVDTAECRHHSILLVIRIYWFSSKKKEKNLLIVYTLNSMIVWPATAHNINVNTIS